MNTMKLLSVCVGEPREVVVDDRLVRTSIFKSPVTGRTCRSMVDGPRRSTRIHTSTTRSGANSFPASIFARAISAKT
jgi:hypothetical protein